MQTHRTRGGIHVLTMGSGGFHGHTLQSSLARNRAIDWHLLTREKPRAQPLVPQVNPIMAPQSFTLASGVTEKNESPDSPNWDEHLQKGRQPLCTTQSKNQGHTTSTFVSCQHPKCMYHWQASLKQQDTEARGDRYRAATTPRTSPEVVNL